jgi:hypothetical protein
LDLGDRVKRLSQRRSGPCGLFSRAEDTVKLSDDVIERVFTHTAKFVELYFTPSAVLWAFCRIEIADSSSTNAVNFSSARTTKRFSSPRCGSTIQIVRPLESIAETRETKSRHAVKRDGSLRKLILLFSAALVLG